MPTGSRREDTFISLFLSAYEKYTWADALIDWLDKRMDGAVDALVTRKSDGRTLAIEHTLIQLFIGEKEDFSLFTKMFSWIEKDPALVAPARNLVVFLPVRALKKGPKPNWDVINEELRSWLIANHATMPEGYSERVVSAGSSSKRGQTVLHIGVQISIHPGMDGYCMIAPRDRVPTDLHNDVERALTKKLEKLEGTHANKRILLLERDQIHPAPEQIYVELVKQRATFPKLARIDEIWFVNTAFYGTHKSVDFVLIGDHGRVVTLVFRNGALIQEIR
jgi:hypothetical protein